MSDSAVAQTVLRKPTVIRTVLLERVTVRSIPAPGPQGPSGYVNLIIDGGGPLTDFSTPSVVDGGAP